MSVDLSKLLDGIGRKILAELQENGRLGFTELGRRVGLSTPAVMERVRRLEEAGLITGYRADVDLSKAGYPIVAMISLKVAGDLLPRMNKVVKGFPEIVECHRLTGTDAFLMKVIAESVEDLQKMVDRLSLHGTTTTSVVLSTVLPRRSVEPKMVEAKT